MTANTTDKTRRSGFVLLMTLFILVLVAVALTSLARKSLTLALEAQHAATELRHKWLRISCQRTYGPHIEQVLQAEEAARTEPVPAQTYLLPLEHESVELIFADEQARLNINRLLKDRGHDTAERLVRQLSPSSLQVDWYAASDADVAANPAAALLSSLEVLYHPAPLAFLGAGSPEEIPQRRLTCWGNGKVQFRRADRMVLEQAVCPPLQPLDLSRLQDLSRQYPSMGLSELLPQLQMTLTKQKATLERLTGESTCHSLTILVQTDNHRSCRLVIDDTGQHDTHVITIQEW